eukprot:Tbor_TRINITY_DN5306_c2_g2::TRINITY_DN5306_c2_g2_i1::g.4353::m.4353
MFCDKLKEVALDYNELIEFPNVLFDLPLLEKAYLAANPIKIFPDKNLFNNIQNGCIIALDNEPGLYHDYINNINNNPYLSEKIQFAWNKTYPDKIIDNLYCGSLKSAQSPIVYKRLNIKYILTVGRKLEPFVPEGIKHKTVVVDDIEGAIIDGSFTEATEFINEAISQQVGCLVHCFAGMSRSATVVIAYLMAYRNMRMDKAYLLTKEGRAAIYPNISFFEQLIKYDEVLFPDDTRPLDIVSLHREIVP